MKPSSIITFLLLTLAAPTWAADLLIVNPIGDYDPQLATLSEGVPTVDSLGTWTGSSLSYTGPAGTVRVEIREFDDTRWLAHNIEGQLRLTASPDWLGKLSDNAAVKRFAAGSALCLDDLTDNCWWVSGNRVVRISGSAPASVIDAYLAKLPPTHATFSTDEVWAADEMERLLASAEARLDLLPQGGAGADLPQWIHRELNSFLRYRDKYYGIEASADRAVLSEALRDGDNALLREKLMEYHSWLQQR